MKAGSPSSFCKIQGNEPTNENKSTAKERMAEVGESIRYLLANEKLWEIRVVIGDGLNNTEKEMEEIADFLQTCGLGNPEFPSHRMPTLQLCQFRSIGVRKPYCDTITSPPLDSLEQLKEIFIRKLPGVSVQVQLTKKDER